MIDLCGAERLRYPSGASPDLTPRLRKSVKNKLKSPVNSCTGPVHQICLRIYFNCLLQLLAKKSAIELHSIHRDTASMRVRSDQNAKHEISQSFGLIREGMIAQECLGTFWDPGYKVRERYF